MILTAEDLCFSYAKSSGCVLDQVSFSVAQSEFAAILGRSGCGKSTLLRILAGLLKADSGRVLCGSEEEKRPDMGRIMVFQDHNQLMPWKTVLGNMLFPLRRRFRHLSKQELHARALQYLRLTGMEAAADKYPSELSGGMKQRAAISRALALEPELLLMDEPFASLDAATREELQHMLIDIRQTTKAAIVFVTHDINEAILLSDTIYVMSDRIEGGLERFDNPLSRPRYRTMTGFRTLEMRLSRSLI